MDASIYIFFIKLVNVFFWETAAAARVELWLSNDPVRERVACLACNCAYRDHDSLQILVIIQSIIIQ